MKALKASAVVAILGAVAAASASPIINGAVIGTRIWNDDPNSILSTSNLYPGSITITDAALDGDGGGGEFANRHNFRLSDDGGISPAMFLNGDSFTFFSDVTISGSANAEGGLNIAPWWSLDVDGNFMANTETGEVAIFGGRLPFYSFTSNHGVTYVKGTTVRMGAVYDPNSLSQADPATIQYYYQDGSGSYNSPAIAFDEGNPNEDPPHGLWGLLNPFQVGGYFLPKIKAGDPTNESTIVWGNMEYTPEPASLALLALGALVIRRRR